MSLFSDMLDIADVERDRNLDAAVAKTMQPYDYHLAYMTPRGKVKVETFTATASEKMRTFEKLGLDDPSKFYCIAQRPDESWTKSCGNKELAKHLSGVPTKFRR